MPGPRLGDKLISKRFVEGIEEIRVEEFFLKQKTFEQTFLKYFLSLLPLRRKNYLLFTLPIYLLSKFIPSLSFFLI